MTDPIADMLTRIRNASMAKREQTTIPYSIVKEAIAHKLNELGYLAGVEAVGEGKEKFLQVQIKYKDNTPVISGIKRISKPGRRVYQNSKELKPILSGYGSAILTTTKGIVSDAEARKSRIGGEVICHVW